MTKEQLQCVNGTKVDNSQCYIKCEGMDVISYNEYEFDSELTRYISKLSGHVKFSKYEANPKLHNHISILSKQYRDYKKSYKFKDEFKAKFYLSPNYKTNSSLGK